MLSHSDCPTNTRVPDCLQERSWDERWHGGQLQSRSDESSCVVTKLLSSQDSSRLTDLFSLDTCLLTDVGKLMCPKCVL